MNTTDKIMALANTYAASNGKALLEKLYGTSQSYTEQCAAEAFKDREALREAIEALVRDAERYRWLTDDHPKFETRAKVYEVAMCVNTRSKSHIDAAIDAAMQEKQS